MPLPVLGCDDVGIMHPRSGRCRFHPDRVREVVFRHRTPGRELPPRPPPASWVAGSTAWS